MAEEYRIVDIWVGCFRSEDALTEYMKEVPSEHDNVAISRFASDQDQPFYDHDFIETGFHAATADFPTLIASHSFSQSYTDSADDAFRASEIASANVVVLAFGETIHHPQSVKRSSYLLEYLGRFECDPDITSEAVGDDGPPSRIWLVVTGEESLLFNGKFVSSIPVDSRGLVIGGASSDNDSPRLDVADHVTGVAQDQVKIYQDQFDQWVIEQVGSNGLTRIDNEELVGRTFPWHGKRLTVGPLEFLWSTRSS